MRDIIEFIRNLGWEEGEINGPARFFMTNDLFFSLTLFPQMEWWTLGYYSDEDELDGYVELGCGNTLDHLKDALPRIPLASLIGRTDESDIPQIMVLVQAGCNPAEIRASMKLH